MSITAIMMVGLFLYDYLYGHELLHEIVFFFINALSLEGLSDI